MARIGRDRLRIWTIWTLWTKYLFEKPELNRISSPARAEGTSNQTRREAHNFTTYNLLPGTYFKGQARKIL